MAEVAISTLLVGVMLVSAMKSLGGATRTWRTAEGSHDGLSLARQLMAEILQQPYAEPSDPPLFGVESPESTVTRKLWDDVDDYNGWSSVPQGKQGSPMTGYSGWTRAVTVDLVKISDPTQTTGSDLGLKRIVVTVTDPTGRTTELTAFRSRWGVLEEPLADDATVQTSVFNQIQVGTGTSLHDGVHLQNHAQDP